MFFVQSESRVVFGVGSFTVVELPFFIQRLEQETVLASFFLYTFPLFLNAMMMNKEKRSGALSNQEIEREVSRNNRPDGADGHLAGAQDTGEQTQRSKGNEVQRNDGLLPNNNQEEHNR